MKTFMMVCCFVSTLAFAQTQPPNMRGSIFVSPAEIEAIKEQFNQLQKTVEKLEKENRDLRINLACA
jgi:septal ring factor EnvC (AmiA/AmiB activator)